MYNLCQNRIKNGRVVPIQSWGKSCVLAYFGLKIGYFGHIFWDIDFKFVLLIVYIKALILPREKLAVCDVTNLPYMDINWESIPIYGDFVTSLSAFYSCADINIKGQTQLKVN